MREKLGICQWFHFEDRPRVMQARKYLRELGIKHLRMDVSWADFYREGGKNWYTWLFDALQEFELLACLWHTPPSIASNGRSNGVPHPIEKYAEFVWEVFELYGDKFNTIELWNEPNNYIKWNRADDPDWQIFAKMIVQAIGTARPYGKKIVLGGMSPIDVDWLKQLQLHQPKLLELIDIVGIHAFPGQWNEPEEVWKGWSKVSEELQSYTDKEIWITETGFSTPLPTNYQKQIVRLREVVEEAKFATRIYWYTMLDLPNKYEEVEKSVADYEEPLERSLGLITTTDHKKPAFFELKTILERST